MAEITLAFGKEIQLTKDKKTGKEIFVKLSVAFKDEQLRELKGAPLSVLICRALHADERGYTFVSNKTISKETGYSEITPANRFLVNKKYLFMEQLVDSSGRFRGWVSRLFLPVEPDFETTLVKGGKKIRVFVKLTELGKSPTSVKPRSREKSDLTRTNIITRTNNNNHRLLCKPKAYGNASVNFIIKEFEERWGYPPTDKKPRYEANILARKIDGYIKACGEEPTDEYFRRAVKTLFDKIGCEDWADNIQTLGVIRRKMPIYLQPPREKAIIDGGANKLIDRILRWAYEQNPHTPACPREAYRKAVEGAISRAGLEAVRAKFLGHENAIGFLVDLKNL